MIINIDGLDVCFPYDYIYPEQLKYMTELKRTLDARGHGVLEMPTGTGKTVSVLALVTSYQFAHRDIVGKLIYCTRTVPEMDKVMEELRHLMEYRKKAIGNHAASFTAIGLSSRRNMCIHPAVSQATTREAVDALCRQRTASWVRSSVIERVHDTDPEDIESLCAYYERYEKYGSQELLPPGVYAIDDLRAQGKQNQWCPYFLARRALTWADVIVYSYQYLLDPKVSGLISQELQRECVVVFDEAHNIDNACIESLSININKTSLDSAISGANKLDELVRTQKAKDAERLKREYQTLVRGLAESFRGDLNGEDIQANPVIPQDVLQQAVPGNIRKAEHFVSFLRRIIGYLKRRMKTARVVRESPLVFLKGIENSVFTDQKGMKFASERLKSLLFTLEVSDMEQFSGLGLVADFATLVATYLQGFAIVLQPFDERYPGIPDPVIQLACLDASITIKPVFEKFQSVILTSGTISPVEMFPRILNFTPVTLVSFPMSLHRSCICPLIVTRGSDQGALSTQFELREDRAVVMNYGHLIIELAKVVPDGMVCFFTSYWYMESTVSAWKEMGILGKLMEHKLLFIETKDVVETSLALSNYRRACDSGRGACFLSIARGKVSEGIDFDRHYGRCVIMLGVPYQYTESHVLRARLEYLRDTYDIREQDFLAFDAIRQAAQCIGRVIRSKTDYGLMVFADRRYNRADKRQKLPKWILEHILPEHMNLSTDMCTLLAKTFLRAMSQTTTKDEQFGVSLLTKEDAERQQSAQVMGDE
eukprot:Rmarinus@m.9598